jgi:hypothetical protein
MTAFSLALAVSTTARAAGVSLNAYGPTPDPAQRFESAKEAFQALPFHSF